MRDCLRSCLLLGRRSSDPVRYQRASAGAAADSPQTGSYRPGWREYDLFLFSFDRARAEQHRADAFPNFFGTSAAAPHVAAVAALMLDERWRMHGTPLAPDTIYQILRESTQDIRFRAGRTIGPFPIPNGRGFDFDSGYGFLSAPAALDEVADEFADE